MIERLLIAVIAAVGAVGMNICFDIFWWLRGSH